MGDIADMYLDGTLCSVCGTAMEDNIDDPPGHPVQCKDCEQEEAREEEALQEEARIERLERQH